MRSSQQQRILGPHLLSGRVSLQVLHPLQQRFLNLINQENFAQISQEEAVKREIIATLEALCGIAEATQIDNVSSLFSFLMDFLSSCIGLMEVQNHLQIITANAQLPSLRMRKPH